jgi:hypothetical protein
MVKMKASVRYKNRLDRRSSRSYSKYSKNLLKCNLDGFIKKYGPDLGK